MLEIFTTNIYEQMLATSILHILKNSFPELKLNFDLETEPINPYPCSHTILRVEGLDFRIENIISKVNQLGFKCDIFEDRICK